MSNYFQNEYFPNPDWYALGQVAAPAMNRIVNSLYPMEIMTNLHKASHIKGFTGSWMDATLGNWHRLKQPGHHLGDMRILTNHRLNYGEFLHHLGMDSLTKQGIPISPTRGISSMLGEGLRNIGFSATKANEFLTVNWSKLLGGGLSLIVAGSDVWACFADTIPHTWTATAWHLGLGALNLACGCFPPNPFILLAGMGEFGVGITTGVRTLIDVFYPTTQSILDSALVGFPMWAETVALSALFGACVGYWSGQSYQRMAQGAGITVVSSATAAAISGALTGNFIAPFIGGAAGFATGLLLRKIFLASGENDLAEQIKKPIIDHFAPSPYFGNSPYFENKYFGNDGVVVPIMQMPDEPIGRFKDGELLLDPTAIRKRFEG